MSVRVTHNVLVPGWIMIVGLALLEAPPLGAMMSLSMFMVAIVVIPALVLIPNAVSARALASTRSQIANYTLTAIGVLYARAPRRAPPAGHRQAVPVVP